jgi:hypothetical protein
VSVTRSAPLVLSKQALTTPFAAGIAAQAIDRSGERCDRADESKYELLVHRFVSLSSSSSPRSRHVQRPRLGC